MRSTSKSTMVMLIILILWMCALNIYTAHKLGKAKEVSNYWCERCVFAERFSTINNNK